MVDLKKFFSVTVLLGMIFPGLSNAHGAECNLLDNDLERLVCYDEAHKGQNENTWQKAFANLAQIITYSDNLMNVSIEKGDAVCEIIVTAKSIELRDSETLISAAVSYADLSKVEKVDRSWRHHHVGGSRFLGVMMTVDRESTVTVSYGLKSVSANQQFSVDDFDVAAVVSTPKESRRERFYLLPEEYLLDASKAHKALTDAVAACRQ